MSSDIEIISTTLCDFDIEVKAKTLGLYISDRLLDHAVHVEFDMTDAQHRDALRLLVSTVQHQLDIHTPNCGGCEGCLNGLACDPGSRR